MLTTAALKITTPACVASWPYLLEPDGKFCKPGEPPVYKVDLVLDPEDADHAAFISKVLDYYEKCHQNLLDAGERVKMRCDPPIQPQEDKQGDPTGLMILKCKMKSAITSAKSGKTWEQRPKMYDAATNPLKPINVGGGSLLKVAGEFVPFNSPKPVGAGITFRMKGVQVLKLVSGMGESAEDMGFGAEEGGFVSETEEGFTDTTVGDQDGNY